MKSSNWMMFIKSTMAIMSILVALVTGPAAFATTQCNGVTGNGITEKPLLVCEPKLTFIGYVPYPLDGKSAPAWGTTPAEVQSLFASIMKLNFSTNPHLSAMVSGMDDIMIARLSTELKLHDTSANLDSYYVVAYVANQASAADLHRFEAAFGPGFEQVMASYTPAATLAQYNATPRLPAIFLSQYWLDQGNTFTDNSTLWAYDLFLDSYTQGAGGPPGYALQDGARYANVVVKLTIWNVVALMGLTMAIYQSIYPGHGLLNDAANAAAASWANFLNSINFTPLAAINYPYNMFIPPGVIGFPDPSITLPTPSPFPDGSTPPYLPPIPSGTDYDPGSPLFCSVLSDIGVCP